MLCRSLGKTPAELEAQLSSEEFAEFLADYRLAPWGEIRGDMQAGIVAATLGNILTRPEKPAQPHDFMLLFEEDQQPEKSAEKEMSPLEFLQQTGYVQRP